MQNFKKIICTIAANIKSFYTRCAKAIKPFLAFVYKLLSKSTVILSHIIRNFWAASLIIFFSILDAIVYLNEVNVIIDQMFFSLLSSTFFVFYKFIEFVCKKVTDSIVWAYKLLRRWKREKFTFVIITHENSKKKDFQLSKLFVYSGTFAVSFAALFLAISSFVLFNINEDLKNEVFSSREKANSLMAVNRSYEDQIESLKNNAVIVSEKLDELNVLEYKIRDMVGLELSEKESTPSNLSKPLSRSSDRTVALPKDNHIYVPEDSNEIIDLMEDEKHIIDKFSKDLEVRLDFLDARPDLMPTEGRITSPFGFRIHPITGRKDYHKGIDIANSQGTCIFSAGSGVVTYVGYNGGYGRMVIISHGYGYKSVYAHLKSSSVKTGDSIDKGDLIALMGSTGISTGSHLHFEIHYNGKQINPLNVIDN